MPLPLPDEDAWIQSAEAQYFIPAHLCGTHDIVSECGWWIGQVHVVQQDGERYLDWLYAYSLKFEGEDP